MTRDIASMSNHAFFSDILYRAVMSDTITNAECREACMRLWIDYPPQLSKGTQAACQEPVFQTSEVNHHGIHCN